MSLPYEVVTSEREAPAQQHIIRLSEINQPLVRLRRAGGCFCFRSSCDRICTQ